MYKTVYVQILIDAMSLSCRRNQPFVLLLLGNNNVPLISIFYFQVTCETGSRHFNTLLYLHLRIKNHAQFIHTDRVQPYSANFPLISLLMYCHKKFKAFKKKKSLRDSVLLVKVPLLNRDLCTLLTTLRTSLSSQKYQPFNLISFEARKILIFYELSQ